jgi:hypothetical protein
MNPQRLLVRKIVYCCIIGALLIPLARLSRPARTDANGRVVGESGGKLAELRDRYRLGQSSLGEVDPTGETIQLASLGMQGIASMTLWWQAHEYKKTENWAAYETTLDQIAAVMPHFVGVWRFQAWNLSYNLPAEFDDYRHRYQWVKKGIEFLKRGSRANEHEPRLVWDVGWFTCQKIGRSDDSPQFRRMFQDEEGRDNWLVGKDYYLDAQRLVDVQGVPFKGMSQVVFHSHPAQAQIYYAKALEEDGIPLLKEEWTRGAAADGQRRERERQYLARWRRAWQEAGVDWHAFGDRQFPIGQGMTVRLNELDEQLQRLKTSCEALYALDPGAADGMLDKRRGDLVDAERKALDVPAAKRSADDRQSVADAVARLVLAHDLAGRMPSEKRIEALKLADQVLVSDHKSDVIQQMRRPVNFEYWRQRCIAEQTDPLLDARRLVDLARQQRTKGRLLPAKTAYEQAFRAWSKVFEQFPILFEDPATGSDVWDIIRDYQRLVVQDMDGEFPKNFILQNVIDRYDLDETMKGEK